MNIGKCGRPRKADIEAENKDRYTPKELHEMWYGFRGNPDEIQILMDIGLLDKNQAIRLSQSYWQEYERKQRKRR